MNIISDGGTDRQPEGSSRKLHHSQKLSLGLFSAVMTAEMNAGYTC